MAKRRSKRAVKQTANAAPNSKQEEPQDVKQKEVSLDQEGIYALYGMFYFPLLGDFRCI